MSISRMRLAAGGERGAEVDRGRGLTDAALLVRDRDHAAEPRRLAVDDHAHGALPEACSTTPDGADRLGNVSAHHMPGFARRGQFVRHPAPFEEKADAVRREEALGERQQAGQGGERAGGDDGGRPAGAGARSVPPAAATAVPVARATSRRNCGLAPVALDQHHARRAQDRQDHPRKAGAAAEVDDRAGAGRADAPAAAPSRGCAGARGRRGSPAPTRLIARCQRPSSSR